ncbi:hypothetical protein HH303_00800 [Rhodospirillaceae bacterium KN72]|uniref:DUF2383 domain-containing protein n=1 Tax=Pacificispira spongiicola TaxID=2729598 RepID=A0A7Y0HCV3_9PROT|nr:hypothetical protein [Pacificispira spongiicola]NMM42995.1 hypothetical protein [Pacificispira spongiicola]
MSVLIPPEIAALNDVIQALWHCARAMRESAAVDGIAAPASFKQKADGMSDLADRLCDIVRELGHTPRAEPTVEEREVLEKAWVELRGGLTGDPVPAAEARCAEAERQLIETAKDALSEETLPVSAVDLLRPLIAGTYC